MVYTRIVRQRGQGKKSRFWGLAIFFIIFLAAIFSPKLKSGSSNISTGSTQEVKESNTSLITSIKGKILKIGNKDETDLVQELNEYLETKKGIYGVYVNELDSGKSFGLNEEMVFPAASTVKVPLLMAVYKNIEIGKISKDDTMVYTSADYEDGAGSIQYTKIGEKWTVQELAKRMMKQSDNVAKNMFFRLLGFKNVQNYITGLGVESVDMSINNTTTPKDAGILLTLIYKNKVVDKELSDEMMNLMVETDFEKRLPRYLEGVRVSHKIGTWAGAISDTGIVFLDGRPYTISVYSKEIQNVEDAENVIGTISKKVYDYEYGKARRKKGFGF